MKNLVLVCGVLFLLGLGIATGLCEPVNTIECEKTEAYENGVTVNVYKDGIFKNHWYLSKSCEAQSIESVCKALKETNGFSDADIKRIKPQLEEAWDKWVDKSVPKPKPEPDTN